MIFGINFNGTAIPPRIKRKFRARVPVPYCRRCWKEKDACECEKGFWKGAQATLQGVAQSPEEKEIMFSQANNGHRKLHVEERKTPVGIWYGIYVF